MSIERLLWVIAIAMLLFAITYICCFFFLSIFVFPDCCWNVLSIMSTESLLWAPQLQCCCSLFQTYAFFNLYSSFQIVIHYVHWEFALGIRNCNVVVHCNIHMLFFFFLTIFVFPDCCWRVKLRWHLLIFLSFFFSKCYWPHYSGAEMGLGLSEFSSYIGWRLAFSVLNI